MSHAREKGPSVRFAASERSPRGIYRSDASLVLRDSSGPNGFAHCPTCAHCGFRNASDLTDPNEPACATCTAPPRVSPDWYYEPAPRGSTSGDAVLSALRGLGEATTGEIASALGADDCTSREYDAIAASLRRLKKHGRVLVEGGVYSINPHPPVRQRRIGTAEERSAAIRAGWATRRQRQNDMNRKAA